MSNRPIPRWALASVLLTGTPGVQAACTSLAELGWLAGRWTQLAGGGQVTETWRRVSAQTFEGVGTSQAAAAAAPDIEYLRLVEMAGDIFYLAKVSHNELPVAFKLTACTDNKAVFENPAHDFPRRLEYRQIGGDRMQVQVSGARDKRFTLDFRRDGP